jgi:hypothetical protein
MNSVERKNIIKKWSELEDFDENKMRFCCGCSVPITKENKNIWACPVHNDATGLRLYPTSRSIIHTLKRNKFSDNLLTAHANTITDYNDEEIACSFCGDKDVVVYYDKKSNTSCCRLCKEEIMNLINKGNE